MSRPPRAYRFVDVVLPVPLEREFTYLVPDELEEAPVPGCRVLVPFGRRRMTGYVVAARRAAPRGIRARPIAAVLDETPLLDATLLELARGIAERYVHPLGEVLRAMFPAALKGRGRTPAETGGDGFPHDAEYPDLTDEQSAAVAAVSGAVEKGAPGRFLLYGVTGSGKTEVYLRCIEAALERGRSALVLIPEIALIPQTTARFRRRFGREVAVLHSRLTGPQRHSIWLRAAAGEARVVIGARSAVFVPMPDLGIVVVDEEQDTSFKQEEKPHYHAVAVAGMRARLQGAALLLGSATPSLESYAEARGGGTTLLELSHRPIDGQMPAVEIVDMRKEEGLFSSRLLDELDRCRRDGTQAIVLLNRRGHANYVQCRACGWIERCPDCSISLAYHSRSGELRCHYCGHRRTPPEQCPNCGKWGLRQRGAGTQRIETDLANLVPGLRVARMDLDTTSGVRGHLEILERFSRGDADVLLGTQMVAKGHHYPNVSLVGVLSGDAGLNFPDFRAVERSFQLLFQAAGRTGRGGETGRVIVQTLVPEHYLYEHLAVHDFAGFAERELALRRELGYPPAGRLLLFTVSARGEDAALDGAVRAADALRDAAGMLAGVLGPAPALVQRVRGRHRFRVLVRGPLDAVECRRFVDAASAALRDRSGLDLQWDVDPVNIS
ncbi:MAG: primosomal protein N' [Candidatus Krumholzibacteriota bacterium]|nr:primosomal protein N' [Candidatus Krumholzibacteriota bacterium]